jgi:hypothetical protein
VLTNAGLIAFTMDVLDPFSESTRYWVFVGFQWICFSMQVQYSMHHRCRPSVPFTELTCRCVPLSRRVSAQMLIMEAIPDVPEEIDIQLMRTEFISRKLIDKVGDDVNEDVALQSADLVVHKHHYSGSGAATYGLHRA